MSFTSTDSSSYFEQRQKPLLLSNTGCHRCDKCETFVPIASLAEHMALKHTAKADSDQSVEHMLYTSKNHIENIDTLYRNQFQKSSNRSDENVHRNGFRYEPLTEMAKPNGNYRMEPLDGKYKLENQPKDLRKSLASIGNAFNEPIMTPLKKFTREGRALLRSDSRKSSEQRANSQIRSNDIYESNRRLRRDMSLDPFTPNRPKVPTVYEMFNLRANKEFRDSNAEDDSVRGQSNGNGAPNQRRPKPKKHPANWVSCEFCSNMMDKDYLDGHKQRKHNTENHEHQRLECNEPCTICGNMMQKEYIKSHIERAHGDVKESIKNKDTNMRCNFCSATMHIDYMPGHLLRKHKSHDNSVGILWPQYTDEQIYEWFAEGAIIIKDGSIYVRQNNSPD